MFGLPLLDFFVILSYFCIMIGIGFWAMRRIHNQEDYFLAGRRFGKFIQTFAAFGQATSSDTAVGVTTTTYTNGASGMWSSLVYLFSTPLYWMVMPWMRRLRLLTLGDFFVERYGSPSLGAVYTVIATVGMMSGLSVGFTAMTKTVFALTPKSVVELNASEKAEYTLAQELDVSAQYFKVSLKSILSSPVFHGYFLAPPPKLLFILGEAGRGSRFDPLPTSPIQKT